MLSIANLIKVYPGPVAALRGVNLELGSGMFGLLGPNGAGKSTLMRIVAGLLEPTSGSVSLYGHDVVAHPEHAWAQLGYLPQDFGFYPHLTGQAMLAYLLKLKGVHAPGGIKRLCGELLDRVNLSFAARRKIKGYSGGMKQRLGIAQAIAGDPKLLIVDEPTAGLDPQERMRFYQILAELAEDRIVLLSTHIVEDVAILCPRFAVIRSGELVAEMSPSEARAAIDGAVYEGRASEQELAELRERHEVIQSILVEGRNRVRLYVRRDPAPPSFQRVEPTLEDAYLLTIRNGALPHNLSTVSADPTEDVA